MKRLILVSLAAILVMASAHIGRRQAVAATQSNNIVWVVEPVFDYEFIFLCSCGVFFANDGYYVWQVNTETGQLENQMHHGHGGPPPMQVYDPTTGLFGDPGYGGDYHFYNGMHPLNEMPWRFPYIANRIIVVPSVDSSLRYTYMPYWGDEEWWFLTEEAYTGRHAVMSNGSFVTDFIFEGFTQTRWDVFADTVAVGRNGRLGLVDRNGNDATPFVFESLTIIDNATAFARYNGRYGILDIARTTVGGTPNPTPSPTQTTDPIYVTTANLNLRQGPSTDAASHGIVPMWTRVYVLEVINDEWLRVRTQPNTRTVEDENISNTQGYMASEFLQAVPPTMPISDFGRQAAEDFLTQFFTIFTDIPIPATGGWGMAEGQFRSYREVNGQWQEIITYEVPDFYFREDPNNWENSGFYDRHGNRITAPWILDDWVYATGFSLWNLSNTGIPDILVYYWGNYVGSGDGGTPASLFRFIDGEYRRVARISSWNGETFYWMSGEFRYYHDALGNLIKHFPPFVDLSASYYYLTFANNIMELDRIALLDQYFDGLDMHHFWANFITGETNIPLEDFPVYHAWEGLSPSSPSYFIPGTNPVYSGWEGLSPSPHFIPGTNMPLTRIMPLTDLRSEITAVVTQRILDGDIPATDTDDDPTTPPTPNQYLLDPNPAHHNFTPSPEVLSEISSPDSALSHIQNTITSLSPLQRTSGDAINIATLQIENIARRGTTQSLPPGGSLDAALLGTASGFAQEIHNATQNYLAEENINLMRQPRNIINFETEDEGEIAAAFPHSVSGIPFDYVTIESEFAAITLNREHISPGSQISVNRVDTEEENGAPDAAETHTDDEIETDGNTESTSGLLGRLWDEIRDFSSPMKIFSNFWFVIVIFLLLIVWLIVAGMGEKLRRWVVPTFAILALALNLGLIVLRVNRTTQYPPGAYTTENDEDRDHPPELTPTAYYTDTVEVTMTPGMRGILSLPANGNDPEFLVLVNEEGEIQHSRYNPVTGNIDARISENGTYTLLENRVSFADINDKNQMMQHAILQLTSRGIMQGAIPGQFQPDAPISRTDLVATMIMAFDMLDVGAQTTFEDISPQAWYYLAVATAQEAGLVSGYPDGTFRGGDNIPKEQLVVMAANALIQQMGYHAPDDIDYFLDRFLDRDALRSWSLDGIALATSSNVLIHRADGMFAPRSAMTRGDAAVILYRVFSRVW